MSSYVHQDSIGLGIYKEYNLIFIYETRRTTRRPAGLEFPGSVSEKACEIPLQDPLNPRSSSQLPLIGTMPVLPVDNLLIFGNSSGVMAERSNPAQLFRKGLCMKALP